MTASISPVLVSKPRPESGNSGGVKLRQPIDLATKSIDSVGLVVVVMQVRGKGHRCVCVCVVQADRQRAGLGGVQHVLTTYLGSLPTVVVVVVVESAHISVPALSLSFFLSLLRDTHMICIRLPYQLPRLFQPVSAHARKILHMIWLSTSFYTRTGCSGK